MESFVSPFFGLANNVKLSFFVYSMKKSAKNVVLTDFKRYPVCGMFLFFFFSCPFSCYKAFSHLHVLHLILSFVQDLVEEGVEVLVQSVHEVATYNYGVVVSEKQLGNVFALVVLKHNAVRLHDGKPFKRLTHALADGAKRLACLCVETLVGVVDPLLHHAACYLLVVIVKSNHLSAVLRQEDVDVGC